MSGNAVAWVYEHFLVTNEVERNRKIILSEVAEAANRDFEHAHPGVAKMAAHWGFDPGTVRRHLRWLVENGWLVETEKGGGRGKATVYRIIADPEERGALRAGLSGDEPDETRVPECARLDDKRAHPPSETRAIRGSRTYSSPVRDTPKELAIVADAPTAPAELAGMPAATPKSSVMDDETKTAHALVTKVWNERKTKPLARFVNIRDLAKRALAAGWTELEVEQVMMQPDCVFTLAGLETQRAKIQAAMGAQSLDRDPVLLAIKAQREREGRA